MFYYELHKWLLAYSNDTNDDPDAKAVADLNVEHVRKLIEIRGHPAFIPSELLQVAIETAHIWGGSAELTAFADHMRNMADSIDVRVRRGSFRTVSRVSDPANEK